MVPNLAKRDILYCFCQKSQEEVATLIAGPSISICDECIECMVEIVAAQNKPWRDRQIEMLTKLNSPTQQG